MLLVVVREALEFLLRRLVGALLQDLEPEWATACALLIGLDFRTSPASFGFWDFPSFLGFGTSPNFFGFGTSPDFFWLWDISGLLWLWDLSE